ncbi:UNVERIFIED_CONTAM: hypothetical protein IGO34_28265, partial [Salmonella enterica subsp. enterica serovar Weltevreden]
PLPSVVIVNHCKANLYKMLNNQNILKNFIVLATDAQIKYSNSVFIKYLCICGKQKKQMENQFLKKLQIKPGFKVSVVNAPENAAAIFGEIPS